MWPTTPISLPNLSFLGLCVHSILNCNSAVDLLEWSSFANGVPLPECFVCQSDSSVTAVWLETEGLTDNRWCSLTAQKEGTWTSREEMNSGQVTSHGVSAKEWAKLTSNVSSPCVQCSHRRLKRCLPEVSAAEMTVLQSPRSQTNVQKADSLVIHRHCACEPRIMCKRHWTTLCTMHVNSI